MVCSKSFPSLASPTAFWASVDIFVNKPHVVNKRLWGRKILQKYECVSSCTTPWQPVTRPKIISVDEFETDTLKIILNELGLEIVDVSESCSKMEVTLVELFPKTYAENHAFQLVCSDKANNKVWFFNATPNTCDQWLCPEFVFSFELINNQVLLQAECGM